ncbi:right-handed parallel beta-helix repeat-containing protein [Methylocystis echinoides]|uniref:Right handed beta helix domain-containing protein n=1 Tax=Methylocystis echinoides TaxID=29468 RepID=A0A9W6GRJ3_9HYPH|nr:right-handed parallel beta-helix repeat-containing protein [Methylocystis echinoides]GLI91782.1 hypothetical protein LMG27198_07740 [Methylocystis echinoides]
MTVARGLALALLLTVSAAAGAEERCRVDLLDVGAVGDGKADDGAAIARALATGCAVTGANRAYRITRAIVLPENATLGDATILAALADDARLAIVAENVAHIALTNIRLDRGADPAHGLAPGVDPHPVQLSSGGVYLSHVENATLTDVEVFGDGVGSGIKLIESAHVRLIRPHVHHMRWASPVQPENEVLFGIWAVASRDVTIDSPRVHDLTPVAILAQGGRADGRRNNMSDGIGSSGAQDLTIVNAEVYNVGEGLDFSGKFTTRNFTLDGLRLHDIDSFCFKTMHADGGVIRRSIAERCGLGGFLLAGRVRNVALTDNEARDIGANGAWPENKHTGFSLEYAFETVPTRISIAGCRSIDAQPTPTTTAGFLNELRNDLPPQEIDFHDNAAQGFTRAATIGFDARP